MLISSWIKILLFVNSVIKLIILLIIVGKKQNAEWTSKSKSKICQICNNFGYVTKDCRSKLNQQSNSRDNIFCRYCKETGYLLENCELRIASNNQRKINEQGNANGSSKSGMQQGSERVSHPLTSQKIQETKTC